MSGSVGDDDCACGLDRHLSLLGDPENEGALEPDAGAGVDLVPESQGRIDGRTD